MTSSCVGPHVLRAPVWILAVLVGAMPVAALFSPLAVVPLSVAAVLSLVPLLERGWRPWRHSPTLWIIGSASVWGGLSCLWTVAPPLHALQAALGLGVTALFGLTAIRASAALTPGEKRWVITALAIGILISALFLLVEATSDYSLSRGVARLFRGEQELGMPQASVSRGAVVVLLFLFPALSMRHLRRWWLVAVLLVVTAVAVIGVGKHATVLALGLGGCVFLLVWWRQALGVRIVRMGVVLAVLAMPLLGSALPSIKDIENGALFNSARHRIVIWHFVLDRWAEHPVRGWGIDAARAIPGGEDDVVLTIDGTAFPYQVLPLHPHNAPLQVWLELGMPGALLLAALLWRLSSVLIVADGGRFDIALRAAALSSGFIISCISYGIWQNWWLATLWMSGILFAVAAEGKGQSPIIHP